MCPDILPEYLYIPSYACLEVYPFGYAIRGFEVSDTSVDFVSWRIGREPEILVAVIRVAILHYKVIGIKRIHADTIGCTAR